MGKMVGKSQCPQCGDAGDGAKDNLVSYEDGSAYCFACDYTIPSNGVPKDMVSTGKKFSGAVLDLVDRKILKSTCEKYGVETVNFNGVRNNIHYTDEKAVMYPIYSGGELIDQKMRLVRDKNIQFWAMKSKTDLLFGMHAFNPTKNICVIVTEGEFDAMCIYQATGFPAVSVTKGANGAAKQLAANLQWLDQWKDVVLCFDMDEPGQKAVAESIPVFDVGRVRVAHLPEKDANDMILSGRGNELKKLIWDAESVKPTSIVGVKDIRDLILQKPKAGMDWPWQPMTDATFGFRTGEIYVLAAAEGVGKCLDPNTPVIMSDGRTKLAKDVIVGDKLMGPDSKPRLVRSLASGVDTMYKVIPSKGVPYIVNSSHILTLKSCTHRYGLERGKLYDIPIKEYLALNATIKKHLMSQRVGIELPKAEHIVDPYLYGTWLGDGVKNDPSIVNMDGIILDYWKDYAESIGMEWSEYYQPSKATQIAIVGRTRGGTKNWVRDFFRSSVTSDNVKYIRDEYLYTSVEVRLQVLAGLIDTDGHLNHGVYEICQKSKPIADGIEYLARSCGLMVTRRMKDIYHRLHIFGNIGSIPVKLPHKMVIDKAPNKDQLSYGITIEEVGLGNYCGFTLDQDGRFLLGDFQITHNTEIVKELIFHSIENGVPVGVFSLEQRPDDTIRRLIGGRVNKRLHIPTETWWDQDVIDKEIEYLHDKVFLYNTYNSNLSFDNIISNIKYLAKCHKTKLIVIDNLTALCLNAKIDGRSVKDSEYVGHVMNTFFSIIKELDITLLVVSHLATDKMGMSTYVSMSSKSKEALDMLDSADAVDKHLNKPGLHWESGRIPKLENIYGSGTVRKLADFIIVLARNRTSEDYNEHRELKVKFLKTRIDSSNEGKTFSLYYNYNTGRLEL